MQGEEQLQFSCAKCQNKSYTSEEIRTTGGGFSRFFDVQNKKFLTVSCTECGFTEMYRANTSRLGNIADFFLGG